jgi:ankyrin repeat protein
VLRIALSISATDKIWIADETKARILDWISPAQLIQTHDDIRQRRVPGTGQWLLTHEDFESWASTHTTNRILWCVGGPGVGKTVLTYVISNLTPFRTHINSSLVIDHLQDRFSSQNVAFAYFYCDYRLQTSSSFAAYLLKQIAMQMDPLPRKLLDFYEFHKRSGPPNSNAELSRILGQLCSDFDQCFIVIDALDESNDHKYRKQMLQILQDMGSKGCKIFVTSRPHLVDINNALQHATQIEIQAQQEDVQAYVSRTIADYPEVSELIDNSIQADILTSISESAQGMWVIIFSLNEQMSDNFRFLPVVLQVQAILNQVTRAGIRRTLKSLSADLSQLFESSIQRIENQSRNRQEIAMRSLMWLSCAQRPILISELLHALATQPGVPQINLEECPPLKLVIESCSGLVTVETKSSTVRLVHYTLQEYLQRSRPTLFPRAQTIITRVCLTYLSLEDDIICGDGQAGQVLERWPLLRYAAENWGHHAKETPAHDVEDLALRFLMDQRRTTRAEVIRASTMPLSQRYGEDQNHGNSTSTRLHNLPLSANKTTPGLHAAAFFGLSELLLLLLNRGLSSGLIDGFGNTALHIAASEGHLEAATVLLDHESQREMLNHDPNPRHDWITRNGRYLHQPYIDMQNYNLDTPLFLATSAGYIDMALLLLDYGARATIPCKHHWTVLQKAADNGQEEFVRILLDRGVAPFEASSKGLTALHRAAGRGHVEVVSQLLSRGASIDGKTYDGWTPLHGACRSGREEVVKLLLKHGAEPNICNLELRTPLHQACRGGYLEIVALLLEVGADRMARDCYGQIALHRAAKGGHDRVLRLLLKTEARQLFEVDESGNTARDEANSAGQYESVNSLREIESSWLGRIDDAKTELEVAIEEGDEALVTALTQTSTNIESPGSKGLTPLLQAFQADLPVIAAVLLTKGASIEAKTVENWTSLHFAARRGNKVSVQLCLDKGADIFALTDKGQTALHKACQSGSVDVIELLLEHGSDIEAQDNRQRRPIHTAAANGHESAVFALIRKGAQEDIRDRYGTSVQGCAARGGHHALVELLRAKR